MVSIKRYHPGVYIKDSLEAMEMTAAEFSLRTGISERTLSAVINGKGSITFDIAYKLSLFFGSSINYWTNLQNSFDAYKTESEANHQLEIDKKLMSKYGLRKYLMSLGCLSDTDSKEVAVSKARSFVGVTHLSLLEKEDSFACLKEQHTKNESDLFAQNFWIALALNQARNQTTPPYNRTTLEQNIQFIRSLTTMSPDEFYPLLPKILQKCGVSFVLLPYLSKSNIYGATRWFNKENVMLALSNRSERADSFWFALFHELAHVLMEHRRETLYQIKGAEDQEADRLAADMLIPPKEWRSFVSRKYFTEQAIYSFAMNQKILPCIVLGRLHKEGIIPYGAFDKTFKVSYRVEIQA